MAHETVSLYRKRKGASSYLVQPMCRHPIGASAEIGEPIEVALAESRSRIGALILEQLDRYRTATFDATRAPRYSAQEYSDFRKRHDSISVTRLDGVVIEVVPMEHVRGGYQGMGEKKVIVEEGADSEQLAEAVEIAFDRAR